MNAAGTKVVLCRQLEVAWSLARLHLSNVAGHEALWEPAPAGPRVREVNGRWRADWPEDEGYDAGAPTSAWLQWHIGMWWSIPSDGAFGSGELERASVYWPGSAYSGSRWLTDLHDAWLRNIGAH